MCCGQAAENFRDEDEEDEEEPEEAASGEDDLIIVRVDPPREVSSSHSQAAVDTNKTVVAMREKFETSRLLVVSGDQLPRKVVKADPPWAITTKSLLTGCTVTDYEAAINAWMQGTTERGGLGECAAVLG